MSHDDDGKDNGKEQGTPNGGTAVQLTRKDFESDQEVRWCPGCGDYAILRAFHVMFAKLGIPREQIVVVSGIGCSSRLPYYVDTYGFHTIHGRAPAVATGIKVANPGLSVWIATGDGDGLSIGGNHLIHVLRRNVDVKIVLFNNRIYGLTKGQYSPTSEQGKKTKSTPFGSAENPFNPLSVALGAEATFVARTVDVFTQHLLAVLEAAAAHRGAAFVEVYQNCNIFNDGAFDFMRGKEVRDENTLDLQHGKPILFGKQLEKGLRLRGTGVEVVNVQETGLDDVLVHDAHAEDPTLAFLLSRLGPPELPTPIGILRSVERPVLDQSMHEQVNEVVARKGPGNLEALLYSGDTWTV